MSRRFPKSARILSSRHFQGIFRERNRLSGTCVSIDYRRGRSLRPRLGITVSKKFGKAHDRNRFKRLIREVFRTSCHLLPQDLEINVSPRLSFKNLGQCSIIEDITLLLAKVIYTYERP
ncbi:MAG: ribonuclease P protein component [Chlamydiota bacterium]